MRKIISDVELMQVLKGKRKKNKKRQSKHQLVLWSIPLRLSPLQNLVVCASCPDPRLKMRSVLVTHHPRTHLIAACLYWDLSLIVRMGMWICWITMRLCLGLSMMTARL